MGAKSNLCRLFALQEQYLARYESYLAHGISVKLDPNDKEYPSDTKQPGCGTATSRPARMLYASFSPS